MIGGPPRAGKRAQARVERGRANGHAPRMPLRLTPAVLSLLVLAAHFLRRGAFASVVVFVALAGVLAMRRAWVPRLVQLALLVGVAIWASTANALIAARRDEGGPWMRMVFIFGAVIAIDLLAIVLLATRPVCEHYRNPSGDAPAAS